MKREALIAAMKDSISDVLEKMFFLSLDFFHSGREENLARQIKEPRFNGSIFLAFRQVSWLNLAWLIG